MLYREGQRIRLINIKGFQEVSDRIGEITYKKANKGKLRLKEGINVNLGEMGIYRISYEDKYELINRVVNNKFPLIDKVTHYYERESTNRTTIVKDKYGDVISVQHIESKGGFNYKVTYDKDKKTTTVVLNDGSIGVAKCREDEEFILQIGHDIAWHRANIAKSEKVIKELSK